MSLHNLAHHMASKGRGDDSMLLHVTPGELQGLQALAMKHGGSLTINPETGLPEAGWLSKLLPMIAGIALGPAGFGLMSAMGAGLTVGAVTGLATGSLSKGISAGLGAYGGSGLAEGFMNLGASQAAGLADQGGGYAAKEAARAASIPVDYSMPTPETVAPLTSTAANAPAMSQWDKFSTGAQTAFRDPSALADQMGGWGGLAKSGLMALSPIMADAMTPTTTKMPTTSGPSTGYIRSFDYNPATQGLTAFKPLPVSQLSNASSTTSTGFADGGTVTEDQVRAAYAANPNATKGGPDAAAMQYWQNQGLSNFDQVVKDVNAQNAAAASQLPAPLVAQAPAPSTALANPFTMPTNAVDNTAQNAVTTTAAPTTGGLSLLNPTAAQAANANAAGTGANFVGPTATTGGITRLDNSILSTANTLNKATPAEVLAAYKNTPGAISTGPDAAAMEYWTKNGLGGFAQAVKDVNTRGATEAAVRAAYTANPNATAAGPDTEALNYWMQKGLGGFGQAVTDYNKAHPTNVTNASLAAKTAADKAAADAKALTVAQAAEAARLKAIEDARIAAGKTSVVNVATQTPAEKEAARLKTIADAAAEAARMKVITDNYKKEFDTGQSKLVADNVLNKPVVLRPALPAPAVKDLTKYNTMTGMSKSAYDYLMGKAPHPHYSQAAAASASPEIVMPKKVAGTPVDSGGGGGGGNVDITNSGGTAITSNSLNDYVAAGVPITDTTSFAAQNASNAAVLSKLAGTSAGYAEDLSRTSYDPVGDINAGMADAYNNNITLAPPAVAKTPSVTIIDPSQIAATSANNITLGVQVTGNDVAANTTDFSQYVDSLGGKLSDVSYLGDTGAAYVPTDYTGDTVTNTSTGEVIDVTTGEVVDNISNSNNTGFVDATSGYAIDSPYDPLGTFGDKDTVYDFSAGHQFYDTSGYGEYGDSGGNAFYDPGILGRADGGSIMSNPYAMAKGGSLGGYSDGGQLLRGPGDGVSDSIPASIGKQPARLADGEFVIPARIVSELGNGSTEAGSRQLYAMLERIQAGRSKSTGKGKVAVNSNASKYLPA